MYISVEEYNILNNYISSLYKTIDGITNGISIYKNFITLQETVSAHKISYDILNDTTKLVEFIQSKNDNTFLEKTPLEKVTSKKQLVAYKHHGFWQCMDTVRDKIILEKALKKKKI